MTENWVLDASPLILLGKAGELHWLRAESPPRLGLHIAPEFLK